MILMAALGSYPNLFFGVIIIANTTIGIVQEIRAKRTIDKLSLLNAPQVKAIRDCKEQTIDAASVVRDDIIKIEAGNQICADCVLLEGQLETDESLLTGESEPVRKTANDTLLSGQLCRFGQLRSQSGKGGRHELCSDAGGKGEKISEAQIGAYAVDKRHYQGAGHYYFPFGYSYFFHHRTSARRLRGVEAGSYSDVRQHDRHDSVGHGAFDKRRAHRFRHQTGVQKGDGQGFVLHRNAGTRERALSGQNRHDNRRHYDGGDGSLRQNGAFARAYAGIYLRFGGEKSDGARSRKIFRFRRQTKFFKGSAFFLRKKIQRREL